MWSGNYLTASYGPAFIDMATTLPEGISLRIVEAESMVETVMKFFSFVGFPQKLLSLP